MAKHFLTYWRYDTFQNQIKQGDAPLNHSAGAQLGRTSIGDHVWFVTIFPGTGRLFLFGHLIIAWVGNQQDAAVRLGTNPDKLWEAKYHIVAADGNVESLDTIEITDVASEFRFSSSQADKLLIENGKVNPQSLQSMRLLTTESANLLSELWYSENDLPLPRATDDIPLALVAVEGKRKLTIHYKRERNQALVARAKEQFKKMNGHLYCEACEFDFRKCYGDLGADFIEAHHNKPLSMASDDTVETNVQDLAMVCSNCHRMIHHRKPWLTVQELRGRLQTTAN